MMCGKCGSDNCHCLCPFSFGIAVGIASAIFTAFCAWSAWLWGHGVQLVELYGTAYYGYAPTFAGGLWGGLWGLIGGFIFGFIMILIYNLCMCCKAKCCGRREKKEGEL